MTALAGGTFLFTLMILWIDPFGFGAATERHSRQVFYQLTGPAYPDTGQRHTAVVLVTEATVKEFGRHWPLSHATHAAILRAILAQRPAALFIDFFVMEARQGTEDLVALLRENREKGPMEVPVLLAAPPTGETIAVLRDLVHGQASVSPKEQSLESQTYPIGSVATSAKQYIPSAAFALAGTLCRSNARPAWCPGRHDWLNQDRERLSEDRELEIVWGVRPPDYRAIAGLPADDPFSYVYDCPPLPLTLLGRLERSLLGGLDALRSDCPYSPTIEAHGVVFEQDDPLVQGILRGRVVFYGAHLVGLPDLILPPTHNLLPGVHRHAMAFDNLVTYGRSYISERPIFDKSTLRHLLGERRNEIVAAIVTFLLFLQRYSEWRLARQPGNGLATGGSTLRAIDKHVGWGEGTLFALLRALCWSLLILAVVLLATWLTYSLFRMAPMNWLGISSVPVAVTVALGIRRVSIDRNSRLKRVKPMP